VLASLLAGSLGLVIGSTVNPKQIGLVFSIIVVPITFLGCVYYPWAWLRTIPLAKVRRALQSHRLHERKPARRRHSFHRAHALVAIWWRCCFFTAALGRWGLRGFLGRSAVVGSCRFLPSQLVYNVFMSATLPIATAMIHVRVVRN